VPSFTARDVQALRQSTGTGMLDAKRALEETDGNMDEAVQWLRVHGMASAAKRSNREAAQGAVAAVRDGKVAALALLRCETDFVAKNADFVSLADEIAARVAAEGVGAVEEFTDAVDKLFGPKFLLERPLLEAVRAGDQAVLLIDEIDRADDEFEAFLLEVLSDFQITIPEIGTIKAESPPVVVLTSNRTRELHDALKRRCLYHWIGYPPAEREVEIVLVRAPGVSEALTRKVVKAVNRLRELDLAKPPGVAETIDWVRTLDFLGETDLGAQIAEDTLGAVVKERDDLDVVRGNLEEITSGA